MYSKLIQIIFIVLLAAGNIYSTENENIYGNYKFVDKDISIEFILDNNGISKFTINGIEHSKNITYDYLGIVGNTFVLQIKQELDSSHMILLNIFVFADRNKIYANSCQFLDLAVKDDFSFEVLRQKELVFNIKKTSFDH